MLAPVTVPAPLPEGFVDIDALVESEESEPSTRESIAAGRRAVADNYYADRPRSLASLRMSNGWSQKELAQRLGTSQSYVARLEAGSIDPQVSTLRRLAAVLNVEPGLLLEVIMTGAKDR